MPEFSLFCVESRNLGMGKYNEESPDSSEMLHTHPYFLSGLLNHRGVHDFILLLGSTENEYPFRSVKTLTVLPSS